MNNAPPYYGGGPRRRSLLQRIILGLPPGVRAAMQRLWEDDGRYSPVSTTAPTRPRSLRQRLVSWRRRRAWRLQPRRLLFLPHLLVVVWVVLLLWGERWVFQSSVEACDWASWESWPTGATPHHLIFIADPQLTDPHSYPDRNAPVTSLTILHSDYYMKRAYKSLQRTLHPDTVFFLGDLFDGGREWKTAHGNKRDHSWADGLRPSGEQAFAKMWGERYGEDFWLSEYDRFGKIFFKWWDLGGRAAGLWQRGRRVISSLPGNHDLGFGDQIEVSIRDRFEAYFGECNRVDVIANHTFVSIDAVSLSAGESTRDTRDITGPVEYFLSNVQSTKRRAVARELRYQAGMEESLPFEQRIEDLDEADFTHLPSLDPGPGAIELPTILLTHVPLYRDRGTPCGPMREHWPPARPPAGQTTPVFPDERNAISISKGYQYQNVLSESDSVRLVADVGNVVSVFSGDDHDYCEVVHPDNKNGAKEITVKSTSYNMGVRRPGFMLLSLWNPIDGHGNSLAASAHHPPATHVSERTMASHLCLLPDQLGILIRYGVFAGITLVCLLVRAILVPVFHLEPFSRPADMARSSSATSLGPLLPSSTRDVKRRDKEEGEDRHASLLSSSTSSTSSTTSNSLSTSNPHRASSLAPRTSRPGASSPAPSYGYGLPSAMASEVEGGRRRGFSLSQGPPAEVDRRRGRKDSQDYGTGPARGGTRGGVGAVVVRECWTSIWRVAWMVLLVFGYLCFTA